MIYLIHKKDFIILALICLMVGSIYPNPLPNSSYNSINMAITPSWVIDPYYNYGIYKGSLAVKNSTWFLFIEPVVTNSEVGKQILGTDFNRFGLNGRIINSYIKYNSGKKSFLWGRTSVYWGQKESRSIIQSNLVPTYDHGLFELRLSNFKGELLAGQLGSEILNDKRITRFISGHRLTGNFFNEKLEIQLGEQIIYTGYNRNIELFYLNPIVPYFFAVTDGDDSNENGINNDNSMIFTNGRYLLKNNYSLFWEFILDDYQYNDTNVQDMLGWKLGLEGQSNFFNYQVNWETEYTQIDSWTYIHHGQFTNWQNRGHAIGYPYGTDLRSFYVQADTWLKNETLKLDIEYTWLEKGANNINTSWGNNDTLDDPFPSEPVKTFHLLKTSILYKTKYATLQTGYTNKPFPYEIANGLIDELKGGFFLSVNFHYKMDINLEE